MEMNLLLSTYFSLLATCYSLLISISISGLIFYLISLLVLVFGILTVTTRRLFRSAIYLLFTLINVAALYFYLNYEFLAAVQIMVYVGGIVVLILFSLFLTQQAGVHLSKPSAGRILVSLLLTVFSFTLLFALANAHEFYSEGSAETVTMDRIGKKMLGFGTDGYVLPFEVVSVLLLAAMIGAIAIAFKTKEK